MSHNLPDNPYRCPCCGKPKHPTENECLGCDKRRDEVAAEKAREFEEEE